MNTGNPLADRLAAVVRDAQRWGCTEPQIRQLLAEEVEKASTYDRARAAEAIQQAMNNS